MTQAFLFDASNLLLKLCHFLLLAPLPCSLARFSFLCNPQAPAPLRRLRSTGLQRETKASKLRLLGDGGRRVWTLAASLGNSPGGVQKRTTTSKGEGRDWR
jgi:hypothetical protein